ncbi:MAG: hypothetical protein ACLVMH_00005, partial [Christensenellales bacterium]
QCAALYLVRILTAARCAGCRQAKSPERVGQSQTDVRGFFLCAFVPSFFQIVFNQVRECTWSRNQARLVGGFQDAKSPPTLKSEKDFSL